MGGDDAFSGGLGDDVLWGGTGRDRLNGGGGANTFVFDNLAGADTIIDFETGVDRIDLSLIDANLNTVENDSFNFVGTDAFDGHARQLRFGPTHGGNILIEGDIDGNGTADFRLLLLGIHSLITDSFVL